MKVEKNRRHPSILFATLLNLNTKIWQLKKEKSEIWQLQNLKITYFCHFQKSDNSWWNFKKKNPPQAQVIIGAHVFRIKPPLCRLFHMYS
jgi:hypothetical protein